MASLFNRGDLNLSARARLNAYVRFVFLGIPEIVDGFIDSVLTTSFTKFLAVSEKHKGSNPTKLKKKKKSYAIGSNRMKNPNEWIPFLEKTSNEYQIIIKSLTSHLIKSHQSSGKTLEQVSILKKKHGGVFFSLYTF